MSNILLLLQLVVVLLLCLHSSVCTDTPPLKNIITNVQSEVYPGVYEEPADKVEARKNWKLTPWSLEDLFHNESDAQSHHAFKIQRKSQLTALDDDKQRTFLIEFYKALGGPNWRHNDNWGSRKSVCSWYGIECDGNWVQYITLSRNGLVGELPSTWYLPYLTTMDLSDNRISGSIPPGLAEDLDLRALVLESNHLEGSIPNELGKGTMTLIHLANNQLTRSVPASIFNNHLISLTLDLNQFGGPVPIGVYSLSSLKKVTGTYNNFGGVLPKQLCDLPVHAECSFLNNVNLLCMGFMQCTCKIDNCNCGRKCLASSECTAYGTQCNNCDPAAGICR